MTAAAFPDHDARDAVEAVRAAIARATRMVGFTGAGVSTESGVPDFRSPGSPWMRNKPIPFDLWLSSADARAEAWRRKFTMDDLYAGAKPSRGHKAMANLVSEGRMQAIVTQNIDGLHQAAGVGPEKVIELHGNGTYALCLSCGARHELADIRRAFEASGSAPVCDDCGGLVKSATVSFGQAMPAEAMRRAEALARDCDLFLAVGSSLVVFPAATLPVIANRSGAMLIIINREPTDLDEVADIVVRADIGAALAPFAA
ncbi:MAG: NAD-dependent deacetylase [Rhizobiales bacterium 65-9]|nr:Sir2 family NAD-dependent protein deacetylase [Hyphomicrobiales bacterium]OJY35690.1 MAG: NAD-dependent deacetylase [Rhizobiales bacterium 65-9]